MATAALLAIFLIVQDTAVRPPRPNLDGVRLQTADGRWQGQLLGRIQFDQRAFSPGDAIPNTMSLRRMRFGASVSYAGEYTFVVEGEFAVGNAASTTQSAGLVNGYLAFDWFRPNARLQVGQFKPAFGLENTGSDNLTDFTERGLQYGFLQNFTYDRGVAIAGTPSALPGLGYAAALTNGTGINTEEQAANGQSVAADGKMVTIRLTENLATLLKDQQSVLHVGVNYQRATAANSPATPYAAAPIQTEGRGAIFFTPQPFNASTGVSASNVVRRLVGYEASVARGPLKLQGEHWQARYAGTRQEPTPSSAYRLDLEGSYVDLLWMVTGEAYPTWYQGGVYGRIRPRRDFRRKGGGPGALQLGVRYSRFDGSDFQLAGPVHGGRLTALGPTTQPTNRASAWTLGGTWVPNPFVRVMVNYIRTTFGTQVQVAGVSFNRESALVARAQIDF